MPRNILKNFFITGVLLLLIFGFAYADDNSPNTDQNIGNIQDNLILDNPGLSNNNGNNNNMPKQNPNFNNKPNQPQNEFNMPKSLLADPEFVGRQRMIENLTDVYNWIALNSTKFSTGCKEDRAMLTQDLISVIKNSQETSDVCSTFKEDVSTCDPEKICEKARGGQIPLSPDARIILKKLGYDKNFSIDNITQDLLFEVCKKQNSGELDLQTKRLETVTAKIKEQLPEFKKKCDEFTKWKSSGEGMEVKLPNFGQFINGPNNNMQGCKEPRPDCGVNGAPFCENNYWKCPTGNRVMKQDRERDDSQEEQVQEQLDVVQEQQEQSSETEEIAQPEQEEQQESSTSEDQETTTDESPDEQESVQASEKTSISIIGLYSLPNDETKRTICGDGICDKEFGEYNCHDDCGPDSGSGTQGPNNQPQNPGQGMRPEILCGLSDDELIEVYTEQMRFGPNKEDIDLRCKDDAKRMYSEISKSKLELAKCKANVALDCDARQQSLTDCTEMKENPDKIADAIIKKMCRRYDVPKNTDLKLYDVANKWQDLDEAFADQMGETADQTMEDRNTLGVASYFFGNGDYAKKLKERAEKLREIQNRLKEQGVDDTETIDALEQQANDFESEANKFGSFFDIRRLGYMFR